MQMAVLPNLPILVILDMLIIVLFFQAETARPTFLAYHAPYYIVHRRRVK